WRSRARLLHPLARLPRHPGELEPGAGGPSFGEERSVEEVTGLRRRDALATRRHQTTLPAAADWAPRLVLAVTRRLVDEQEPLDVGDRRITRDVPLDRLGDVDRLRLLVDHPDVLAVVVLRVAGGVGLPAELVDAEGEPGRG